MAGLFETDDAGPIYNCYVTVGPDGFITKLPQAAHVHQPAPDAGQRIQRIDLLGCQVGFLICYDNNLPENVRITAMMGARSSSCRT